MRRLLYILNKKPADAAARLADPKTAPLRKAWAAGKLADHVVEVLNKKQGIYHTCAEVAARTHHSSAGKVSCQLYM